jgi:hypothetical protein
MTPVCDQSRSLPSLQVRQSGRPWLFDRFCQEVLAAAILNLDHPHIRVTASGTTYIIVDLRLALAYALQPHI